MKKIIAAGGLVQNQKGEYLFIFRRGKWDLPKGKVDKGENIEDAALREVREECGITDVKIIRPLIQTEHSYELSGEKILKQTHWFLMQAPEQILIPQTEEDITQAVWAKQKQVKEFLSNTYDSIVLVVERCEEVI